MERQRLKQQAAQALQAQQLGKARKLYRKLCSLDADDIQAQFTLGLINSRLGNTDEALDCFTAVVRREPRTAEAWFNMGLLCQKAERLQEAEVHYRKALQLKPDFHAVYNSLGSVLAELERFDEARENYETALRGDPRNVLALNNYGSLMRDLGQPSEAEQWYGKAIALRPDYGEAHWNRAVMLLKLGRLAEGWAEFEWGLRCGARDAIDPDLPLWNGSTASRLRLLVLAEQGVGDEVMFASCIPDLVAAGVDCVFECDARLVPLFARSFPNVQVVAGKPADEPVTDWLRKLGTVDAKIAAGSLPRFFRSRFDAFPERSAYLSADPDAVMRWRKRISSLEGLKVGISWRGGAKKKARRERSTVLQQWIGLLSMPGASFVNLQYGAVADELAALKREAGIVVHDFPEIEPLRDLDGFAACISALDLVVSIDNATVHLAGALGVPTWVLLPSVADWRWMLEREDSPWYSSITLLRQKKVGDWEAVFAETRNRLRERLGSTATTHVLE